MGKLNLFLKFFERKKQNNEMKYCLNNLSKLAIKFKINEKLIREILYLEQYNSVTIIPIVVKSLKDLKKHGGTIPINNKKEVVFQRIKSLMMEEGFEKYVNNSLNKAHRVLNNLEYLGLIKKTENSYVFDEYFPEYYLFCIDLFLNYHKKVNCSISELYSNTFSSAFFLSTATLDDYLQRMNNSNMITLSKRAGLNYFNFVLKDSEDFLNVIK